MKKKRAKPETKLKPRSIDLLGLEGIVTVSAETHEWFDNKKQISRLTVMADAACEVGPACPSCGSNMPMSRHDSRHVQIKDIPHGRSHVCIDLKRSRYKCKNCSEMITVTPQVIHSEYRMTRRLVDEIGILGLQHPFSIVSEMTGVDEKTIRVIVGALIDRLKECIPFVAPVVVGIDEVHAGVLQAASLVITDIEKGELLELSEDGLSRDAVEETLAQMTGIENVLYGVSDMAGHYHNAMANKCPGISTIVDKRHIQIKAREALTTVREQTRGRTKKNSAALYGDRGILNKRRHQLSIGERAKIKQWSQMYPRLGKAYDLKEGFYDLFDYGDFDVVWKAFEIWSASIPADLEKEFAPVRKMFISKKEKIRAYFVSGKKFTNAVTEAINGLIKAIKRNGRGYSHKVLRAKALYKHGRWNEEAIRQYLTFD